MFDIRDFTETLKNALYDKMPNETESSFLAKHKKRSGRFRDIAFGNNPILPIMGNGYYFELGNTQAEVETPQYHILEDAEVIRKRGRGTATSRGSQANIDPRERDYGQWTITKSKKTGETNIFQEYRKNVRGQRSKLSKAQRITVGTDGAKVVINKDSPYYENIHYHYIEKSLEGGILNELYSKFNLKKGRTKIDMTEELKGGWF